MTHVSKIITGGKVALPAAIRKSLALNDGDSIVISEQDGKIVIQTRRQALMALQDEMRRLVPPHIDVVGDFLEERRAEAAREDAATRGRE